jgi:uncharacterized protein YecA (UPF0149 family)
MHPAWRMADFGIQVAIRRLKQKRVKIEMKIFERLFNSQKQADKKESLGRNDICWCGSGKKYKRCHLDSDAHKRRMRNGLGGKPK